MAAFREAQKIAPRHGGAAFGLGRALALKSDFGGARAAFERCAELEPSLPQPRLALVQVLASQKSFAEAHAQLKAVEPLRGGRLLARIARVDVLLAEGRTADAVDEQQAVVGLLNGPAAALATVRLGDLQQQAGRPGEAAKSYRQAVQLDPKSHIAWNNAAWLAAERKLNLDQALVDARKAVELAPLSANYHDTLATVLAARGEHAQAAAAWARALELSPGSAELKARLAQAREQAGGR